MDSHSLMNTLLGIRSKLRHQRGRPRGTGKPRRVVVCTENKYTIITPGDNSFPELAQRPVCDYCHVAAIITFWAKDTTFCWIISCPSCCRYYGPVKGLPGEIVDKFSYIKGDDRRLEEVHEFRVG